MPGAAAALTAQQPNPQQRFDRRRVEAPFPVGKLPEPGQQSALRAAAQGKALPTVEQQHCALFQAPLLGLAAHRVILHGSGFEGPADAAERAEQAGRLAVGDADGFPQFHDPLGEQRRVLSGGIGRLQQRRDMPAVGRGHHVLGTCQQAHHHAHHVSVHRRLRFPVGDGGDGPGGVVPDAGQGPQRFGFPRQLAAVLLHDLHRRFFQVPRPAVITQALPELEEPILLHLRQGAHIGERLQEAGVILPRGFDPGLLQHDLRDPDLVGRGLLPPGQGPPVGPIPGDQPGHRGLYNFLVSHALSPSKLILLSDGHYKSGISRLSTKESARSGALFWVLPATQPMSMVLPSVFSISNFTLKP